MKQRKLTGFVLAALLFCGGMTGCGGSDGAELTKRVKPLEIEPLDGTAEFCDAQMQFAVSMLHQAAEKAEENYVISPYLAAEAWLTAAAGSSAIQTSEAFGSISLSLLNGSFVRWRETQTDFTEVMSLWIPAAEKNSISPDVLRTFLGLSNTQVFSADQKQNELERWLHDVSGDAFSGVSVPEDAGRFLFSAASVSMTPAAVYLLTIMLFVGSICVAVAVKKVKVSFKTILSLIPMAGFAAVYMLFVH